MNFLKHREGVWFYGFYISFTSSLLYSVQYPTLETGRGCVRFEDIEISSQSCRGYSKQQGGKLLRLLSGFRPRIQPLIFFT
jgi:hypothetical protein